MRKTTLREIKQSLGRYLAIMAIVALGVGFFAGLKATKPAMVATTQKYLEELQFYDYRLLSTLGFEQEDVDFFASREGIRAAEGSVSLDIVYVNDAGNESVLKMHSLTEKVNGIYLTAGRMPETDEECVVDSNMFSKDQIGEKICLSNANNPDDLEHFKYREYTIVGIAQSSYYIQFERGNTTLGNGKISGFVYLLPGGFDIDYYTEIFVKFQEDFDLYGQEYKDFLEEKEPVWEELTELRAQKRFDDIVGEAEQELADAREELDEKKAEAEQELDDAQKKLDDAYAELTDGETKIADGEKEIRDAEKKIRNAQKEIEEGEAEIAENEQELRDAEAELAEKEAELPAKEQELADAQRQWDDSNSVLQQKKSELAAKESQLREQVAAINDGLKQLAAGEEGLKAQELLLKKRIESGEISADSEEAIREQYEITVGFQYISQQRAEAQAGLETVKGYQSQLQSGKNSLSDADRQLREAKAEIDDGRRQLEEGKQQIADARAEIADGWAQIADARAELEDARAEVKRAKRELGDAKKEIEERKQELEDGWTEYTDGLKEYADAKDEFETEIADAEAKIADARQEIDDLESPSVYVLGRNTNVGYVCFENDSSIVEGIANIFPLFFFLVAALVCMTTMNRMVEEQRTQIGVLKALGYSEWKIMSKYMFYSGSAAFTGCVGGFLLGTYLFPRVIWSAYGIMYNLVPLEYVFETNMAIISLVVSIICSAGTTWLSCRYELSEVAAQLMRPKSPKAGKRVILEYLPFIWKRLKFLHKVSARNIFRYKRRFFMMIIGISGCTALLVTGFGLKDSITSIASQQFEEIQIFDIAATFKDAADTDTENEFRELVSPYVEEWTYAAEQSIDLKHDGQIKALNLIMVKDPEQTADYISLHTDKGETISYPEKGEIVVCRKIAETYDLKAGDEILLQDDEMRTIHVTVSGICENYVYNYVYLNADTYQEQIGIMPEFTTVYMNLREDADAHQTAALIMGMDEMSAVTVNADMMDRFSSMMSSMDFIVIVIILCAAALAFIVLYNLTNINITERIREIATIKVLGFYKSETASYVFRENTVLTIIGAFVGLGLGFFLHRFVMSQVVVDMVSFDVHVKPVSYLYSFLLTLVFSWLVNKLMAGKLEKINMAESLKSVD
ncbi:MAG: FtsX-like permease family protein, partial [Lachnospiraceae bacterium]|nr:FtsX-like permease family protein [Lachnospiraceae bacterium]